MSYSEVHRLPIRYRRWFLDRLVKHFNDKNKAYDDAKNRSKSSKNPESNLQKLSQFESHLKSKL